MAEDQILIVGVFCMLSSPQIGEAVRTAENLQTNAALNPNLLKIARIVNVF